MSIDPRWNQPNNVVKCAGCHNPVKVTALNALRCDGCRAEVVSREKGEEFAKINQEEDAIQLSDGAIICDQILTQAELEELRDSLNTAHRSRVNEVLELAAKIADEESDSGLYGMEGADLVQFQVAEAHHVVAQRIAEAIRALKDREG